MSSSFHRADRRTYRRVVLVGVLFCAAFVAFSFFAREQPENTYVLKKVVAFSFFAREQPENTYVLKKADRLVRTAGEAAPAH